MTQRDYLLLDVFTDRLFGGNQLAVFPDAVGLSSATMQAIARELNLSESVFVLHGEDGADARLRFFTPAMELPFAGHPTIGAAVALASVGGALEGRSDVVFAEGVGLVPVAIRRSEDGALEATLTSPLLPTRVVTSLTSAQAATIAGVALAQMAEFGPQAYSAGVPFHFLPLHSPETLATVSLDLQAWQSHLATSLAPHVVVLAMEDWEAGREIHLRMFAPLMGIAEDPATGAAAAALAGLLVDQQSPGDGTHCWVIRQGEAMGRPSTIHLEVDVVEGHPAAVRVGGTAVIVGLGTLQGLSCPASSAARDEAGTSGAPVPRSASPESAVARLYERAALGSALLTAVAAGALLLSPVPASAQDFTGPRLEISMGYDELESDGSFEDFDQRLDGVHGRVAVGYDAAIVDRFVIGVEASIGGTRDAAVTIMPAADSFTFRPGRDIDVLARLGYRLGSRSLVYVKVGWANAAIELTERERVGSDQYEVTRSSADNDGVRLGAGVEYSISDALYVKAEYRYTTFGDGYDYQPGSHRNQVLLGVGYRF
ncbi:PhzF family phenazine biosynthesis isomerase [Sphingosinithalassobacter sp. CS137]|uniref:PhzF family phenazine biosynthesis isomerase n=1 Tax=Sphingosinithalassobacter sp. CS137 TaxID=2762748 RepID=UPI00165D34A3|nr:PhzF family phenazine biosynthesis isomerase [Sphingosinithalassobacter sp. CS137]